MPSPIPERTAPPAHGRGAGDVVVIAALRNGSVQYFYRDWYGSKNGYHELPAGPGFGYELDEAKIPSRAELP